MIVRRAFELYIECQKIGIFESECSKKSFQVSADPLKAAGHVEETAIGVTKIGDDGIESARKKPFSGP